MGHAVKSSVSLVTSIVVNRGSHNPHRVVMTKKKKKNWIDFGTVYYFRILSVCKKIH